MNPETQIAVLLKTAVGILAVWTLWHFGIRQWAIDSFRQELFAARDRIFDIAARNEGGFGFQHPSYGSLRIHFNSSIRYAHRVNMVQIVFFSITSKILGVKSMPIPSTISQPAELLSNVDDSVQAQVMESINAWESALFRFLVRTSPLFYLMILAAVVVGLFRRLTKIAWTDPVSSVRSKSSASVWASIAIEDSVMESSDRGMVNV